jgi:RNA polymerase sigma-70 factor, ECF subfamily
MVTPESIERLYDEHAQALFAFLLNFTRDEADTRDLIQEIFVKIARQPDLLKGIAAQRAYLLRLAHNLAVDLIRRRSARTRRAEAAAANSVELFARAADPDENTFGDALSIAMGDLPEDQRAVVHLKLWEGMTFDSIGEVLDLPLNTAASRYRYGIDKLRHLLRPIYEELK